MPNKFKEDDKVETYVKTKQEVWYYITLNDDENELVSFSCEAAKHSNNPEEAVKLLHAMRDGFHNNKYELKTEIRDVPITPEREFPKTSLSGDELRDIFYDSDEDDRKAYIAVANAAIKQYILDKENENA